MLSLDEMRELIPEIIDLHSAGIFWGDVSKISHDHYVFYVFVVWYGKSYAELFDAHSRFYPEWSAEHINDNVCDIMMITNSFEEYLDKLIENENARCSHKSSFKHELNKLLRLLNNKCLGEDDLG